MGERIAGPKDYAQWGAERGFAAARTMPPDIDATSEAELLKTQRAITADYKQGALADGSSQDEVDLYERCFEMALHEGRLAAKIGTSPRPIRVKTDDGDVVIED